MKTTYIITVIVLILIAGGIWWASQTGAPATPADTVSPSPVTSGDDVQPGSQVHDLPVEPAAQKAREDLAIKRSLDAGKIVILEVKDMEWPDACLGISNPEEMCAQVITPGFKVTMEHQGETYIYRTNKDGSMVRAEE